MNTTREIEPAERGTLQIAHLVVRKVAEYAAGRVVGTASVERRVAGLGVGRRGASARVAGSGNDVDLRLDLALHYPAPVREVVEQVRTTVTAEVEHLTSYRIRALDVTVSALVAPTRPRVH
ncbi:Asp23/Gls24 family envelope stress response protein [Saccharomonospora sp. NPDC046836]|uniref:Asp23/Gls24 family envelope stress response protein n=1 Tax=Saccharomonospora sp. NPDC046836 TaxID=3156921 RepID=UPI0033FEF2C9